MKTKYLMLIALLMVSIPSVLAISSQLFIVARMDSAIYAGDLPIITGKIVDQLRKPVSEASVQANYPTETINATTNPDGTFTIIPTKPASVGEYGISIIGTKDGYEMTMSIIEYSVLEKPPDNPITIDAEGVQKGVQDVGTLMVNGLTRNPLAEMLSQQMELAQKQQEKQDKIAELQKESELLGEQRKIVNDSLQQDLVSLEKDTEFYNPFNAFSRFVSDIDSSVQNIFWGQFNLTQQQHIEAHNAKMEALENQYDSKDAMKIYREKAAVSRSTIIQLNNDLNARYSNSSDNTQSPDSQIKMGN